MSIEDVVAEYSAAWSETDPAARLAMLERTVVADVPYVDPGALVVGVAALSEVIAGVQEQLPGAVLLRTSAIDQHHDVVRFSWVFVDPAGAPLLEGIDVCRVADDGRIASFTVFFGPLAEEPA